MDSNPGRAFKQLFVARYEALLRAVSPLHDEAWWQETFLLRVNRSWLAHQIGEMSPSQLLGKKRIFRELVEQCHKALTDASPIRAQNAAETLCVVLGSVFLKKFTNFGLDVIEVTSGFEHADATYPQIVATAEAHLTRDAPVALKASCLQLLTILASAADNLNQNSLVEFLVVHSVFETLAKILIEEKYHESLHADCVVLLSILVNYQKYDYSNPYVQSLAAIQDDAVIHAFAQVINSILVAANECLALTIRSTAGDGVLDGVLSSGSSLVHSVMGAIFSSSSSSSSAVSASITPSPSSSFNIKSYAILRPSRLGSALVLFYELLYLNRNFLSALYMRASSDTVQEIEGDGTTFANCPPVVQSFVTLSSFVLLHPSQFRQVGYTKMCLLILQCLSEDIAANTLFYDTSGGVEVFGKDTSLRTIVIPTPPGRPLVVDVLDIIVHFMANNLKRKFEVDLYCKCTSIIHWLLCFAKSSGLRPPVMWIPLWRTLIKTLGFVCAAELFATPSVLSLVRQILLVLNFSITFGGTFLPSSVDYDHLFYEILRLSTPFQRLARLADQQGTDGADVLEDLVNIKTIVLHFSTYIQQEVDSRPDDVMQPDQVLEVLRAHYDTLQLKLYGDLENAAKYVENPREVPFFQHITRNLVMNCKSLLNKV